MRLYTGELLVDNVAWYRRRGYAKALVHAIASDIVARGEAPFLHVRAENAIAIATYERLGFVIRHRMHFTIVKRR